VLLAALSLHLPSTPHSKRLIGFPPLFLLRNRSLHSALCQGWPGLVKEQQQHVPHTAALATVSSPRLLKQEHHLCHETGQPAVSRRPPWPVL